MKEDDGHALTIIRLKPDKEFGVATRLVVLVASISQTMHHSPSAYAYQLTNELPVNPRRASARCREN
jgi:hypothetical protein